MDETKNYHQELIQTMDTPEVVRKRMEQQLMELKSEMQQKTDDHVNKLLEKKFYDEADELRKNNSQAFEVECYLEQENQMLDKLKRREKEKEEEMFYVKLNEFDNLKKIEKEKKDELDKKNKLQNIYNYQQWQREQNELDLKHKNDLKLLENSRLKEQWRRDDANEEENKLKRIQQNIQVYKDIEEFNKKEEIERQKKIDFEKAKDKELIDSILEKERALDEIDKAEKLKRKQEFIQNKKYLEYVLNQKKEAEAWMDKLAQDEADKAYQKEKEEWLKEEAKRIQLLKDVYKDRERAVLYHKQLREDEKVQILKEREILDEEIRKYNQMVEEINRQEALRRKTHQGELKYQINEKDNMRRKEQQDKLYEERAAQLWEMEYQKKIDEQKALHLQRLAQIKARNNPQFNNNNNNNLSNIKNFNNGINGMNKQYNDIRNQINNDNIKENINPIKKENTTTNNQLRNQNMDSININTNSNKEENNNSFITKKNIFIPEEFSMFSPISEEKKIDENNNTNNQLEINGNSTEETQEVDNRKITNDCRYFNNMMYNKNNINFIKSNSKANNKNNLYNSFSQIEPNNFNQNDDNFNRIISN